MKRKLIPDKAMFFPKNNPGFDDLAQNARALIVRWTKGEWYESSFEDPMSIKEVKEEELGLG